MPSICLMASGVILPWAMVCSICCINLGIIMGGIMPGPIMGCCGGGWPGPFSWAKAMLKPIRAKSANNRYSMRTRAK